ncbi:MAG: sugar phosphate isomerase/epimerase family protein [Bryobacteraceae bacterium]
MSYPFRHAVCNEVYEGWKFPDTCRSIKKLGYQGIEIAPFTLNEYPATITQDERREYRRVMADEGLEFVGLHWLMVSPKGLHVTAPDKALREKSWQHIRDLVDLCADLAKDRVIDGKVDNGIMVFGSPYQRGTTGGISRAEATRNYVDGLASVVPHAENRNVTILVEALPSAQCDVINLVDESAAIVREIGSPAVRTMFDTHNAADETDPHPKVVDRNWEWIRHIHVNEMDGREPGTADYPFGPVFELLAEKQYKGWISLEVFDFKAGAEKIAGDSLRYLEGIIARLKT